MLVAVLAETLTFEQFTQLGMVGVVLLVQGVIAKLFMKMWSIFREEEAKRTDAVLDSCERIVGSASEMSKVLQASVSDAKNLVDELHRIKISKDWEAEAYRKSKASPSD